MAADIGHEIHDLPLSHRLIAAEVRRWLDTGTATVLAGLSEDDPARQAIDELRHLHLSGYRYSLVPNIVDALTRAGLMKDGDA